MELKVQAIDADRALQNYKIAQQFGKYRQGFVEFRTIIEFEHPIN